MDDCDDALERDHMHYPVCVPFYDKIDMIPILVFRSSREIFTSYYEAAGRYLAGIADLFFSSFLIHFEAHEWAAARAFTPYVSSF